MSVFQCPGEPGADARSSAMGQTLLLLLCWVVTTAGSRGGSAEGAAYRQEPFSPSPAHREADTGEQERDSLCRLQPTAPAVLERPELLLVPAGVPLGAAVARVQLGAPGVECRLEPGPGRGFGLRETADGHLWLVTTARLHRERRHEYELRLVSAPARRGGAHVGHRLTVRVTDRDTGANGSIYRIVGGAPVESLDGEQARALDLVAEAARDSGRPPVSATARMRMDVGDVMDRPPEAGRRLSPSLGAGVGLAAICGAALPLLLLLRCLRGKRRRGGSGASYNCRQAESRYTPRPRRPQRRIGKADIALLRPAPHAGAPAPQGPGCRHHCLLRELVRMSLAGCPDTSLELAAGTPQVQQISQLLSLLHQGQFQARPNFRGNKYLKNRTAVPEADRASLKDSGQGESEEGDSDSDTGRISPIEQLLEEGLSDLLARNSWTAPTGTGARASAGEQLSLEELCWSLPSPLCCDYRENVFNPRSSGETEAAEMTTFSTFGKGGSEQPSARGSLLNEMSALFQHLLAQKAETFGQPEPRLLGKLSARWSVLCEGEVGTTGGRFLPSLLETPEQSAGSQPPQQPD